MNTTVHNILCNVSYRYSSTVHVYIGIDIAIPSSSTHAYVHVYVHVYSYTRTRVYCDIPNTRPGTQHPRVSSCIMYSSKTTHDNVHSYHINASSFQYRIAIPGYDSNERKARVDGTRLTNLVGLFEAPLFVTSMQKRW